jgi:hypothetical protein
MSESVGDKKIGKYVCSAPQRIHRTLLFQFSPRQNFAFYVSGRDYQ